MDVTPPRRNRAIAELVRAALRRGVLLPDEAFDATVCFPDGESVDEATSFSIETDDGDVFIVTVESF